jgi:hypothetical protein
MELWNTIRAHGQYQGDLLYNVTGAYFFFGESPWDGQMSAFHDVG